MILPDDISVLVNFFRFFRISYASRHVIATKTTTTTTTMAVDGKKTCSRLAAATVLWLLVAIFANQNYVHCQAAIEEEQKYAQKYSQQLSNLKILQQREQQQEQQQLLSPPQQPLSPPEQPLSLSQQPPPQQPPPNQPQSSGIMGPLNMMENSIQPSINKITKEVINPDFGSRPITQQLSNGAGSSNIPIGDRVPMFSGSLPVVTGSQQSQLPMQTGGPPQAPSFVETNPSQGMISNSPSLQTNRPPVQNTWNVLPSANEPTNNPQNYLNNPQHHLNNPKNHLNKQQNPLYNHHQYPLPMQQKPMMQLPPHSQRLSPNHHFPLRLPMDQQGQRPNQMPYYMNGNSGNGYEVSIQTSSNVPSFPSQLNSFMNPGELLQPVHMLKNIMPANPMQIVQKPAEMIFNTVDKFGRYGEGVKEGLTTAFKSVVGKIFDQTQSGAQTVFDLGSNGTNAILNFGRRLLVPETLKNQQNPTEYGGQYYSPQQGMQPPNYAFNPKMSPPNYGGMGYNNMQPQAGTGQVMAGNSNGQMFTQRTAPQYNTEYASQEEQNMPNSAMFNPISGSQPIIQYGQP